MLRPWPPSNREGFNASIRSRELQVTHDETAFRPLSAKTGFLALTVLGASLIVTNRYFTEVDDEVAIIDAAAKPVLHTITSFLSGGGQHEHPPLSDLLLHEWLRITQGNIHLLRVPSIVFYLIGVWFMVQAAGLIADGRAKTYTLLLLLIWPYGFHFGRLAGWYAFSFMLVSFLTFTYLKYLERATFAKWITVVLCSLALIYTNYFAWALLACLSFDLLFESARDIRKWLMLLATAGFLVAVSTPILLPFIRELHYNAEPALSISAILTGVYNLYCLFISESVAPWFWVLGIAAGIAIACTVFLTFIYSKSLGRRILIYFFALLIVMTVLQIGNTKRMLMISPWLILPIGTVLSTANPSARRRLTVCLGLIGAIGWYGILARNVYAAPHWLEPWDQVARQAANLSSHKNIVVGNNPSFFFYLTYLLPETSPIKTGQFAGFLPDSISVPNIYAPEQWSDAGAPTGPSIVLFDGLSTGLPGPSSMMDAIRSSLNDRCLMVGEQRLVRDFGAEWKRRFRPDEGYGIWRIRITTYDCSVTPASR